MNKPLARHHFPFRAMGCPCELQLYAPDAAAAAALHAEVRADIERIEARYSRYRPDSLLAAINAAAAVGGSHQLDSETEALLGYADTCYRLSGGRFDISSGPLRRVWRFEEARLPDAGALAAVQALIGWEQVRWEAGEIRFLRPGMELDFGGIAKEYAADRAAGLCLERGMAHGLIDLGGDIRIFGPHPDGQPWSVGIRHPRLAGSLLGTVLLYTGAVATSGDYARSFIIEGERYSHLLNARTGWPVRGLAAVTVIAEQCVVAGSASTIAMLLEAEGPDWLTGLGLEHCWMDLAGRVGGSLPL